MDRMLGEEKLHAAPRSFPAAGLHPIFLGGFSRRLADGNGPATFTALAREFSRRATSTSRFVFEIDVCAYEVNGPKAAAAEESGGVATATKIAPEPTLTVDADLAEQY